MFVETGDSLLFLPLAKIEQCVIIWDNWLEKKYVWNEGMTLKALEKIFGDKAQLAEIFFTGYQLQLRQIMNLQESRK